MKTIKGELLIGIAIIVMAITSICLYLE